MEKINKITAEQLIFPLDSDMGRVCTDIRLADYDWMEYIISTKLTTPENGEVKVIWDYYGCDTSRVMMLQLKDGLKTAYVGTFNSEIFQNNLKNLLFSHNKQWEKGAYAFNGEDEIIEFFNETLDAADFKQITVGKSDKHLYFAYDEEETEIIEKLASEYGLAQKEPENQSEEIQQ